MSRASKIINILEAKTVVLDLRNVDVDDDDNTSRFSGTYKLNGKKKNAFGDDRGDNHFNEIAVELEKLLGPLDKEEWFDVISDLPNDAVRKISVKNGKAVLK